MKLKIKIGASMSDSDKKAPYLEARDALAALIAQAAHEGGTAPLQLAAAVLEEAFNTLQATILGNGLDEEALSSSFMTSLASAGRFWSTCWIWEQQKPADICWIHYNKTSESRIGADFALLVATPGTHTEPPGFRMIVIQAKLQKPDEVNRLSIEQAPAWGAKLADGQRNPKAEAAEQALRSLLDDANARSIDVEQDHFQLSKLIELRNRFRELNKAQDLPEPDILYAIWPAGRSEPLYRKLADAIADIQSHELKKEPDASACQRRKITQSIDIKYEDRLRHWLLNVACGGGDSDDGSGGVSMGATEAKTAFDAVKALCSATIILDLSGTGLGLALLNEIGLAPAPALEPVIPAAQDDRPTLNM
ncbi:hypothetical protein [Rugamonas sp. DEMB1]|uniref:hypothetical protein n=1 Tax=Rugamonas sp. DEMB1 TaxID=3039386 RepID=UPI00244AE5CE|nr:hypothetical protein [Rugamonas sp. DEMB1]WGG48152.1 hypothetical protein QC826_15515 [Rugamonas sp. DEMB1]